MIDGSKYLTETIIKLPPSGIRRFFDLASHMEGVISLGVGEPDFVTPWHIREACFDSLERGYTMYTANPGLIELREEIAKYQHRRQNLNYDPEREILVTVGVSEPRIWLRVLLNPGDEVLSPSLRMFSMFPVLSCRREHRLSLRPWRNMSSADGDELARR